MIDEQNAGITGKDQQDRIQKYHGWKGIRCTLLGGYRKNQRLLGIPPPFQPYVPYFSLPVNGRMNMRLFP
ncbi:MAG: hypothetical protein PHH09_12835, partial [Methanoregulaceae archaeon]|nr:hypothetical protein [Methanoregulaceae archaeon]